FTIFLTIPAPHVRPPSNISVVVPLKPFQFAIINTSTPSLLKTSIACAIFSAVSVNTTFLVHVLYAVFSLGSHGIFDVFNREGVDVLIIANWKGFSGTTTDMFEGVLKSGAGIVKNLVKFQQRVIIYIPPLGELRGGTYLVFDKKININISMVTHPTANVGILQPGGLAEIKMKNINDKRFAEIFCKLHDDVYRMVRSDFIDGYVAVKDLREYIIAQLNLTQ
ncbi:MAG: hypothetical protein O7C59_09045, partial [Rickettsia endosymbiont of Ixodes persulcatus]|nr:hypothetical protein [Rickettsia endosymbiont of Ixodes persulcatus]